MTTLQLCILVSLAALATAQIEMGSGMEGTFVPNSTAQYLNPESSTIRARHFYCLGAGKNRTDFPIDGMSADGNTDYRLWSIFLQFPVLSYLDSQRKENLFNVIASLVQRGGLTGFNETEFCVGKVFNYEVSTYQESVLVQFSFSDSSSVVPVGSTTIQEFNTAFIQGFNSEKQNTGSSTSLVKRFQGRYALAIDSVMPLGGLTEDNFHPRANLPVDSDPTLRAVVLGSYVGGVEIEAARSNQMQTFAPNPNPLNFNLEPGDIIFAVFGSIFITITVGLVLLGFCIHPFFLA